MLLAVRRLKVSSPARTQGTTPPGQSFYAGTGGHHFLPAWEQRSILVYRCWVCSLVTMPRQGSLEGEDAELRRVQRIRIYPLLLRLPH